MKKLERVAMLRNWYHISLAASVIALFWVKGMFGSLIKTKENVWEEYFSTKYINPEPLQTTSTESKLFLVTNRNSINVKFSAESFCFTSSVYLCTSVYVTSTYSQEHVICPTTLGTTSRFNFTSYKKNIFKVEKRFSLIDNFKINDEVLRNKSIHERRFTSSSVRPLQIYDFKPDIQNNASKNYTRDVSSVPKIFVQLLKKKKIAAPYRIFSTSTRKWGSSFRTSVIMNDNLTNNYLVNRKSYFTAVRDSGKHLIQQTNYCPHLNLQYHQPSNEFIENIYVTGSSGHTHSFIYNSVNPFIPRRVYTQSTFNNNLTPDSLINIFNNYSSKSQRHIRELPNFKILNNFEAQCFIYQYICAWLCKPISGSPCPCLYSPPTYCNQLQHFLTALVTPYWPYPATFHSPPCPISNCLPTSLCPQSFPFPPGPYPPFITIHYPSPSCGSTKPVYTIPPYHSPCTPSFCPSYPFPGTSQCCSTKLRPTCKTSSVTCSSKRPAKSTKTTLIPKRSSKFTKTTLMTERTSKFTKTTTKTSKITVVTSPFTASKYPLSTTTRGTPKTPILWTVPDIIPTIAVLYNITFIFVTPHVHTTRNTTDYAGGDDRYHGYNWDCLYGLAEC